MPPPARALHREAGFDADAALRALSWAVVAFSCVQILLFSFGRDQGIYAVVADTVARGGMPYRDVWDFKPPGIFIVYWLAQALFGHNMLAPRVLEVLGLVGLVFAFRRLAKTWFDNATVGLVGGAIAALVHAQLEFWHTAQPETFGGYLTVFAIVLTVGDYRGRRRFAVWAAIGLLFGLSFLLKPPVGGGAVVCAAYLARRERLASESIGRALLPFVVVGLSSIVPIAVTAAWFSARGAWPALHQTLFEFTPHYTAIGWQGRSAPQMFYLAIQESFTKYSAVIAAGSVAAFVFTPLHSREREGVFLLLGVVSMHLTGIAMQGKFFPYHYAATLPLLAMVAGLGVYKVWRRSLQAGPLAVGLFATVMVVLVLMREAARDVPHSFWERSWVRLQFLMRSSEYPTRAELDAKLYYVADYDLAADRKVAALLRERTREGQRVFVWGFEPVMYWLSDRTPPTRFIYNVAQRVEWSRDWSERELMASLRREPPVIIVVEHHDVFPMVTGDTLDSDRAMDRFTALSQMVSDDYEHIERIQDFDVYRRRGDERARND